MSETVCFRSGTSPEETLARLDLNDVSVEDWVDAVGEPTLTPLDFTLMSHPSLISYEMSVIWAGESPQRP